jgi:hypothetical protein
MDLFQGYYEVVVTYSIGIWSFIRIKLYPRITLSVSSSKWDDDQMFNISNDTQNQLPFQL